MPSCSCLKDHPVAVAAAVAAVAVGAYVVCTKCCNKKPKSDAELVTTTWALVSGDLQAVGDAFYKVLFDIDPSLKTGIFGKSDIKVQALRLMQMVDGALGLLNDPVNLRDALLKLGERHVLYGVTEAHYAVVGKAFIATLKAGLKEKMTPEATAAWVRVYGFIQQTMLEGSKKRN